MFHTQVNKRQNQNNYWKSEAAEGEQGQCYMRQRLGNICTK